MELFSGERLRRLRREQGWSRERFAREVESTTRTITFYETNERKPSIEKAIKMADVLGVSLDYLCNRSYIRVVNKTPSGKRPKVFDDFYTEADTMTTEEYMTSVKAMIDRLKAMAADLGLSNTGDEYKIISELFTYKFLNDKVLLQYEKLGSGEDYETFLTLRSGNDAGIEEDCLIRTLYQKQQSEDFHKQLRTAFEKINKMNERIFAIETITGQKKKLFEPLSNYIRDEQKEKELAVRSINILHDYDFRGIVNEGFDYFSNIFEYLIRDYNKDSGKYAEYFTPASVADIISEVLYDGKNVTGVKVYDPAAGSGTLLLSMANKIGTSNCTIYSQDISHKSTQFLRINLILNNLVHSLRNVVEGDTLLNPAHLQSNSKELRKFDFIVSNPPFRTDFSSSVERLKKDPYHRFFAGLPNIPKKKKDSMAIYETFFQHIIASMAKEGKGAVVVPTGFVSAEKGIPHSIKKKLVDENWLMGVIHMPSQIFANTGTSVSILFIDKGKKDNKVMMLDASSFGRKVKMPEGQRTLLSDEERTQIIDKFKSRKKEPEFSVWVDNDEVKKNNYSISAGRYVDNKKDELDFDIDLRLNELTSKILDSFSKKDKLVDDVKKAIKGV